MQNTGSLAVRYRPQTFDDGFIGQPVTAKILKAIIEKKAYKNIMLFAGNSGCGKTTSARIVAKLINNGVGDPIEIDGASNNGVDQVRSIITDADQRSLTGQYKIYIIDECHALSNQAWQAFLKTIEEPPKYTIFIFCTTDPQKIPIAVLNRMQRFNFTSVPANDINKKLLKICEAENFVNYEQCCELISHSCNGCVREAINQLERCADYSNDLRIENCKLVLGSMSFETMFKLTWAIQQNNMADILVIFDQLDSEGQELKVFIDKYLEFILDLLKYNLFKDISITNIPAYLASTDNGVVQYTLSDLNVNSLLTKLSNTLLEIKSEIKFEQDIKNIICAMIINFCEELNNEQE